MAIWHPELRGKLRTGGTKLLGNFGRWGKPSSAGREPPQNSQDNDDGSGKPVIVRYTFGVMNDFEYAKKLLPQNPWIDHVSHPKNKLVTMQGIHDHIRLHGMPYLLIEDFNTTGLVGDAFQFHPDEDVNGVMTDASSQNGVIWFLRATDVSTPRPGRGGSHGMGKLAFPDSSEVCTMFVVTSRDDEQHPRFLSGMSVLENRVRPIKQPDGSYKDAHFGSEMYFCSKCDSPDEWEPIVDNSEIEEFCKHFGIDRPAEKKGTSILIPFPHKTLTPDSIAMSVISNYALPIQQSKVIFEISNKKHPIDANTVREFANELPWHTMKKTVSGNINTAWSTKDRIGEILDLGSALSDPEEDRVVFPIGSFSRGGAPDWSQEGLLPDPKDKQVEICKSALNEGKAIHLVCSDIPVKSKNPDSITNGSFHLIIKKSKEEEDSEAFFYRGQVSLPSNTNRKASVPGFSSLLFVDKEDPLGEMLVTSEGPAHMKWESTIELESDYHWGPSTYRLLIKSVDAIFGVFNKPTGEAEDFLTEIFLGSETRDKKDGFGPTTISSNDYTESSLRVSPRVSEYEHGYVITPLPYEDTKIEPADWIGRKYVFKIGYSKADSTPLIPKNAADSRVIDIRGKYSPIKGVRVDPVFADDGSECPDRFMFTITSPDFEVDVHGLNIKLLAHSVATRYTDGSK